MLLLILVLIPFIFSILCWQCERIYSNIPQWLALIGVSIICIIIIFLYLSRIDEFQFLLTGIISNSVNSSWQIEYVMNWIPRFGINIHLALDGLSLLMLMLSGLLGLIAICSSWNEIHYRPGLFYLNLLWLLGSSIGFFLTIDMFLLFFFWEIMLIPMFFLICIWGYKEFSKNIRVSNAIKFFLYAQISSLLMLVTILILAFYYYTSYGVWSFDYEDLLCIKLSSKVEYLLMLAFFLSFAIKMPIVPFHFWLSGTHSSTPVVGSVDLVGILLKTAVYGLFRFTLTLFPYASQSFSIIAMVLGIISMFYGSWMAFIQIDFKRFIAYTNLSHMGLILIAIYSNNQISYQGAIVQLISCSLSASGMFILCGQLYKRLRTRNINLMGGLWDRINVMPALSLCFIVSMLGIPGTGNFIGEATILLGVFQNLPIIAVIAAFGILFTSIYSLKLMQCIYYGKSSGLICDKVLNRMTYLEQWIAIVLLLCIFIIGLFPQFILNTSYDSMHNIYMRLQKYEDLL